MRNKNRRSTDQNFLRASSLLLTVRPEFLAEWHWFQYHARADTPFMMSIASSCAALDRISQGAPQRMLSELAAIRGRNRDQDHYNQLLQKLSEILVMQQIVGMPWPEGTTFEIEGATKGSPKQVDCVVSLPNGERYGFEIKSPAHVAHASRRGEVGAQIPARGPDGMADVVRRIEQNVVLPRDNTIRDFLRSANNKLAAFKNAGRFTGILVVVWDDFIYEAIGPLTNERNGLITDASYSRIDNGPEKFPNIDAVILMRHLSYFVGAAAEKSLPDQREHAFHVGGPGSLPNVLVPVPGGRPVSALVVDGFNALPHDDEVLQDFAEYRANELIFWVPF